MLQNPESDALEFIDEFKMNLYSWEIVVFTPKGKMVSMPKGATVIDFAYEIHTDLGNHCIGAKINHKLMPISHVLQSGDQVEILTSKSQKPDIDWLKFITSAKAKAKVKQAFKLDKKRHFEEGREIIEEKLKAHNIKPTSDTLKKLTAYYNLSNKDQLYAQVGMGFIDFNDIDNVLKSRRTNKLAKYWRLSFGKKEEEENVDFELPAPEESIDKKKTFILKENLEAPNYSLAKCCQPIPGDNVLGYLTSSNHVVIHKRKCPEANKLMSQQGDRIITAEWTKFKKRSYLSRIKLNGFDRVGIVSEITNVISKLNNINMRTVMFDTHDGIFEGELYIYIHNVDDLNNLIARLQKIKGVDNVERMEKIED